MPLSPNSSHVEPLSLTLIDRRVLNVEGRNAFLLGRPTGVAPSGYPTFPCEAGMPLCGAQRALRASGTSYSAASPSLIVPLLIHIALQRLSSRATHERRTFSAAGMPLSLQRSSIAAHFGAIPFSVRLSFPVAMRMFSPRTHAVPSGSPLSLREVGMPSLRRPSSVACPRCCIV